METGCVPLHGDNDKEGKVMQRETEAWWVAKEWRHSEEASPKDTKVASLFPQLKQTLIASHKTGDQCKCTYRATGCNL